MNKTIVVIDDDPLLRWTMAADLQDAGFCSVLCSDGEEALKYLSYGGEAAAVLLDLHLQSTNGGDVLRQLHGNRPDLPVILMTGDDRAECKAAALANGASSAIDKTQSFLIVLQHVKRALTRKVN